MHVTRTSMMSGKIHTMDLDITREQVLDYQAGTMVQDAFPNLTPEEREFIMTGVTPEEWVKAFGNEQEDENDD